MHLFLFLLFPLVWLEVEWYMYLLYAYKNVLNSSQLAKMKKGISYLYLPWNLKSRSSWLKEFQIYLKTYEFCEYAKFGATSWEIDICQ